MQIREFWHGCDSGVVSAGSPADPLARANRRVVAVGAVTELPARLRAVAAARLAFSRKYSGPHEFDGQIQDLSPNGVRKSLRALDGPPLSDSLDDVIVASPRR